VSVLLGNGDGTFQDAVSFAVGDGPYSVAVGDFDGDAVPDLVTANEWSHDVSVLLGNGDGTFQAAASFVAGDRPYSVAVGDFDGDAFPDLVTANRGSHDVSVLLNLRDTPSIPIVTAHKVLDCTAQSQIADVADGETLTLNVADLAQPVCIGIGVLMDARTATGDGSVGHDYMPAPGEIVTDPHEGEISAPYAFADERGWVVVDEIAACTCEHPERGDLTYPGMHTLTTTPCSADFVGWLSGDKAAQCVAAGGVAGAPFTTQLDVVPEPGTAVGSIFGSLALAGIARRKRRGRALVRESETCRRILLSEGLVQAPIANDTGRPSSVIRFRMLHAISASASCDLG